MLQYANSQASLWAISQGNWLWCKLCILSQMWERLTDTEVNYLLVEPATKKEVIAIRTHYLKCLVVLVF